jgi:glycosyltransferase involved in cell wall biosynthesis
VDIVFVGRIVPIKQPDHVCEVIRRVAVRRPGLRAVVAGTGPLLPAMKQMASEKGLGGTIRFAGHVERVEGLLARSRIFLLTSYSEGLSIALAEAMMAGAVPVVANVGDLGELVENGRTGWLISSGDFDGYAEKIVSLLSDPQMWAEMSARGREKALANNGLEAVTRRWESAFSEVVRGRMPNEAEGVNRAPRPEVSHFA